MVAGASTAGNEGSPVENVRLGDIVAMGDGISSNNSTPRASGDAANQAGSSFCPLPHATTYEQQLSKLKGRGLVVNNEAFALAKLEDLNYYRLRGFWLTLEQDDNFADGASFDDIWEMYQLDRDLRGWLWRAIAPIEIKLRTQFAYQLSHLCGPGAYLDAGNFGSKKNYDNAIKNFTREQDRAYRQKVPCVVHNMDKYGKLPLWAAVEIMSFGTLSMLYGNLNPTVGKTSGGLNVADAVAKAFGTKRLYLKSWTHHLVTVRNIVAHHDRFYGRTMSIQPTLLRCDARFASNRQYPTLIVIKRIYERSWPDEWNALSSELSDCIEARSGVDLRPMGFPAGWRKSLGL